MSTKENANRPAVDPIPQNCAKASSVLKEIFDCYSNDEIQKALEGLICMASESQEFGHMTGMGRNNTINFVMQIKTHFAKAAVCVERMGGELC
jgi:hypothetical protein